MSFYFICCCQPFGSKCSFLFVNLLNLVFQYQFISEILRWRAVSTADHVLFSLLNAKGVATTMLTCSQLHKRAERVGTLLVEKGKINTGDHVALIFPPGIDLICAFYGCLYVGKCISNIGLTIGAQYL